MKQGANDMTSLEFEQLLISAVQKFGDPDIGVAKGARPLRGTANYPSGKGFTDAKGIEIQMDDGFTFMAYVRRTNIRFDFIDSPR